MFNKLIEKAQKGIEGAQFEARKYLVEFDNVIGKQREIVFKERDILLEDFDPNEKIDSLINYGVDKVFSYEGITDEEIKENLYKYILIKLIFL